MFCNASSIALVKVNTSIQLHKPTERIFYPIRDRPALYSLGVAREIAKLVAVMVVYTNQSPSKRHHFAIGYEYAWLYSSHRRSDEPTHQKETTKQGQPHGEH